MPLEQIWPDWQHELPQTTPDEQQTLFMHMTPGSPVFVCVWRVHVFVVCF
jgi:hypothetical protein